MPKKTKSFEENIKLLEEIIEKLESGSANLDECIELYEKGISLSKDCSEILENAQQKVKIVTDIEIPGND